MKINRIYQGRVTGVSIKDAAGEWRPASFGHSGDCPLWHHHVAFQDGVNYYLLALAALADPSAVGDSARLMRDLRSRLQEAWHEFPRRSDTVARSLRSSLSRWLGLASDASLADALALVLAGNQATSETRRLALDLLLHKSQGEGNIQQAGRGYFPRFCLETWKGTYDFSDTTVAASSGRVQLASVLHGESSLSDLKAVAARMSLSWTVKVQPDVWFEGQAARERAQEAAEYLRSMVSAPADRLAVFLNGVNVDEDFQALSIAISCLPDTYRIQRNRKAAQQLTFASIAFMVHPCELTRACLRSVVKAPTTRAGAQHSGENSPMDFGRLGDDPIRLARGSRGFVFPAFTALPGWGAGDPGAPKWKEFDIAAFKEALKALNQFRQKTADREADRLRKEQVLKIMLGQAPVATRPLSSEEPQDAEPLFVLGGDPRFETAQALEADLTDRLMLGASGRFRISHASLRGVADLVERWGRLLGKNPNATEEQLKDVVKAYQADPKIRKEIGSVPLMLALCEPEYRRLWATDEEGSGQGDRPEGTGNILRAMARLHDTQDELDRALEPIRLTPAEPTLSRRLFMFSDLQGRSSAKFADDGRMVEVSLALDDGAGLTREVRAQVTFSAPRMHRDELVGGGASRWLQPMTAALGIPDVPKRLFDSAVALMPDLRPDGTVRHLMNFPTTLDCTWIQEFLGKADRWATQFNGTRDSHLHLHWPGTFRGKGERIGWWDRPDLRTKGFTVLANDLGQRTAGAWALLSVTASRPNTTRPFRSIGKAGSTEWFAEICRTGLYRLPGEDARVLEGAGFRTERAGKRGRLATADEWQTALTAAVDLGIPNPESWIPADLSYPRQNDQLIRLANRRLSRLATYHRWSCFDPGSEKLAPRKAKVVSTLVAELEAFDDLHVRQWLDLVRSERYDLFRVEAGRAFENLREKLLEILLTIADRTAPLRRCHWAWRQREGASYGQLVPGSERDGSPRMRGQRGLSMARVEQLDGLRRLFLRYNRALDRQPGVRAKFGFADRGRDSGEPCPYLLSKIDRIKDQRINQTAHLILAQALGVRLAGHRLTEVARRQRDMHGEYEPIPGRSPVDFIVIEDLSRYLSSQGRSPSENSRLMKWAHRAVRNKLKMLAEEPFGIPVVEVVPAYSSRFHAGNGQPGGRLAEKAALDGFDSQVLARAAESGTAADRERGSLVAALLEQFSLLATLNEKRRAENRAPRTLVLPKAGGPLFLAAWDGGLAQADTNAAANLGLRAIAAPGCIDIHRRVRATRDGGHFKPRRDNAREKAGFSTSARILPTGELSKRLRTSADPNFFFEPDGLASTFGAPMFDRALLDGRPLVSGVSLWSAVGLAVYRRCVALNRERLAAWSGASVESF